MSRFSEYATSTAFRIDLSRNQVELLKLVADRDEAMRWPQIHAHTAAALQRKGMVYWSEDYGYEITTAGKYVYHLLKECDL